MLKPKLDIKLSRIKMTNFTSSMNNGQNGGHNSSMNNNNYNNTSLSREASNPNDGANLYSNGGDLLYSYLDNETDIELVDSLKSNSLKAVKVFQKPYYQEEIKGEIVHVPSWRMKEKVSL